MIRGPYSHEPGRLECILLGMQGLGGPGVHQWQMAYFGMPRAEALDSVRYFNPALSERPAHARPEQRRRLGHAAHPQDPHPGGHPQRRAARLLRHRRAERGDRGPVHQVPVPDPQGRGRHRAPHDLDRHALPHHLLEPRQLDHRGPSRREHRVHRGAAPVAGERLPLRRHHPAGQHHDRGRGHRHQRPAGTALPDVHAAGARPSSRSASPRATTRSSSPIAEKLGMHGAGHRGQDHRGPAEGGLRRHGRRPAT